MDLSEYTFYLHTLALTETSITTNGGDLCTLSDVALRSWKDGKREHFFSYAMCRSNYRVQIFASVKPRSGLHAGPMCDLHSKTAFSEELLSINWLLHLLITWYGSPCDTRCPLVNLYFFPHRISAFIFALFAILTFTLSSPFLIFCCVLLSSGIVIYADLSRNGECSLARSHRMNLVIAWNIVFRWLAIALSQWMCLWTVGYFHPPPFPITQVDFFLSPFVCDNKPHHAYCEYTGCQIGHKPKISVKFDPPRFCTNVRLAKAGDHIALWWADAQFCCRTFCLSQVAFRK